MRNAFVVSHHAGKMKYILSGCSSGEREHRGEMADSRRKPRVRKTAPTVREEIAEAAKQPEAKAQERRRLKIGRGPLAAFWAALKKVLRPLAPVGRLLKKVLSWLLPRYFLNSWREVKQVTWPSRRETWRLTGAVFVFAVVFGALVAVVDKGLDELFKRVVLK